MGPRGGASAWRRRVRPGRAGRICALAVLGAGLSACSDALGPVEDDLEDARELWAERAPLDYSFVFRRSCFCASEFIRPVRIIVDGETVVSAVFADDGMPIETPLSEVPTIPDLFDEIRSAIEEADEVTATFDEGYGHPLTVMIDFIEQAIDDEMYFEVSGFDVLAFPL